MLRLRPITKGTWRRIFKLYNSGAHPKYRSQMHTFCLVVPGNDDCAGKNRKFSQEADKNKAWWNNKLFADWLKLFEIYFIEIQVWMH